MEDHGRPHHLQIDKKGFFSQVACLSLPKTAPITLTYKLARRTPAPSKTQMVNIQFQATPQGTEVRRDKKKRIGFTPFWKGLEPHTMTHFEFRTPKHVSQSYQVLLHDHIGTIQFKTSLEAIPQGKGTLSLTLTPAGSVYIKSRSYGREPIVKRPFERGSYPVVVVIDGERKKTQIDIRAGEHNIYSLAVIDGKLKVERTFEATPETKR